MYGRYALIRQALNNRRPAPGIRHRELRRTLQELGVSDFGESATNQSWPEGRDEPSSPIASSTTTPSSSSIRGSSAAPPAAPEIKGGSPPTLEEPRARTSPGHVRAARSSRASGGFGLVQTRALVPALCDTSIGGAGRAHASASGRRR
jgi:hypothetical protein